MNTRKMEHHKLDGILKEKLYEGDPYVDMSGWENLKKSISAVDEEMERKRYALIPFFRYAAALLLIIGLGAGGYFLFGPKQRDIKVAETTSRTIDGPAANYMAPENAGNAITGGESANQDRLSSNLSAQSMSIESTSYTATLLSSSSIVDLAVANGQQTGPNNIVAGLNRDEGLFVESPEIRPLKSSPPDLVVAPEKTYDLSEYLRELRDVREEADYPQDKLTVLFAANAISITGKVDNNHGTYGTMGTPSSFLSLNGYTTTGLKTRLLLINHLDNTYALPSGNLVHKLPVSFGASVNKQIGGGLGVGTGLFYTYMESHIGSRTANNAFYQQKLHYLGIPVSLSCPLLKGHPAWSLYAKTGFAAEKALMAKGITTIYNSAGTSVSSIFKDTPSEPMLSLNMGVGVGYKLFGDFTLYAEPLLQYYFYTKGQPISYKTDRTTNFSVRMGIKIDL